MQQRSAPTPRTRNIVAAILGNALEWFDILIYAAMADIIAALFFPSFDATVGLLLSFGMFGVSYVVRPIGGIVIGRLADRRGRRTAMATVSVLMAIGTAAIAFAPTYATAGAWAPAILLAARLIQGFSAGGEFGSATAYLAEQSPTRRAYYSSWQFASQGMAMLLAALVGLLLSMALSPAEMTAWGWRIPFVIGLLIAPMAYFIRFHIDETPEFERARAQATGSPPAESTSFTAVLIGFGLVLSLTVTVYFLLFLPILAKQHLGFAPNDSFIAALTSAAVLSTVPPISGALADRFGHRRVALPALSLLIVVPGPAMIWLAGHPSLPSLIGTHMAIALALALYMGVLPALLSELFPVTQRTTGIALSYNFAVSLVGGPSPLIFALLVTRTGAVATPAATLLLASLLSAVALYAARGSGRRTRQ